MAALTANLEQRGAEVRRLSNEVQTQQDLAKLAEDLAVRNRDLAEVNGKLQSARQALADAREAGRRCSSSLRQRATRSSNWLSGERRLSSPWRP